MKKVLQENESQIDGFLKEIIFLPSQFLVVHEMVIVVDY
jgi:hypothetical protein